jgi:hypothetical protein
MLNGMTISNQVRMVLLSAFVLAACTEGDEVPPGQLADAGFGANEIDARVSPPDATPPPDAVPGAPDAEPMPDASPPDAGPPPVSFQQDLVPILMARCGGCHLKDALGAGGLSLGTQAQLAYSAIVDQPAHNASCSTMKLVDTSKGDPMQSALYLKLIGLTCGTQMPKGQVALTQDKIDLFGRWITEGSANN